MTDADLSSPVKFTHMRPDRAPDFVIGPIDNPYMLRWWLLPRNEVFNVYYHVIRHSDDDRAALLEIGGGAA